MLLQYKKMLHNVRLYAVLFFVFVLSYDAMGNVVKYSIASGETITPWILPHIFCDRFLLLCFTLTFVLLICDAPYVDTQQYYIVVRTGKEKWLIGEFLFTVTISAVFVLLIWIICLFMGLGHISLRTDWGDALQSLANPNRYTGLIQSALINNYSAIGSTVLCAAMLWMMFTMLSVLTVMLRMLLNKAVALFVVSVTAILDFYIYIYMSNYDYIYWLSPVSWVNPLLTEQTSMPGAYVRMAILIFANLLFVGLTCFCTSRPRHEIQVEEASL
jgi:hypothetical protein